MNRFFMPYHLYQVQWLLMPGLLRQVPTTCVTVGLCSITGRQKWNPGDTSLNFCPVGRSDPSAFDAVKIQQLVSGPFCVIGQLDYCRSGRQYKVKGQGDKGRVCEILTSTVGGGT